MKSFKLSSFDYNEQQFLWDSICQQLGTCETLSSDALMVANWNAAGTKADALLVCPKGIVVLALLGLHGTVTASELQPWTYGSRMVEAKGMCRTTFHQMAQHCREVGSALQHALGMDVSPYIKACVVLNPDTTLENHLSPEHQAWLQCLQAEQLTPWLAALPDAPKAVMRAVADHLQQLARETTHSVEVWTSATDQLAECAQECYAQLLDLMHADTPVRQRYPALREVLRRTAEIGVSQSHLQFKGLFAKLDFIVKENHIPAKVAQQVQFTRKMMDGIGGRSDEELSESFRHDVKAVALLIAHLPQHLPVPTELMLMLPEEDRLSSWGAVDTHVVRCLVEEWDDEYIYGTEEQQGSRVKACYGQRNEYLSRGGTGDWSYLRDLLSVGCVLNFVRVRMAEGVCMPELIIFEPDYLLNITTVANCFETYDESPLVNLINKIKPQPNTGAIHLGNLAGQYLDDTIHQRAVGLEESYAAFLRNNALGIATCADTNSPEKEARFVASTQTQLQNISHLIGHDLPLTVKSYDPDRVVLEPTFVSEVLGLQGRMDFCMETASGQSLIIEQKSGKGAWNPRAHDKETPDPQVKHWVQLMLYRAVLTYEFQRYDKQQQIFLLYSKYARGLVAPGTSPDLLLRAIKLRNQLAWSEIRYAEEGMRLLERLTPERLNRKGASGTLWENYTRPELEALLRPMLEASDLERAYYFRMMQFLQKENLLAKIGSRGREDSGFASKWLDSTDDKLATGNIYHQLTIERCQMEEGCVVGLRLAFAERKDNDNSNFRLGDIVMLYPYIEGQEPLACTQMVTRGSISAIDPDGVELVLNYPQTNPDIFDRPEGYRWAVEHDMFESSNNRLYGAMHSLFSAPKERRDLLLGQRLPRVDETLAIKGEYGAFNPLVTRAKQARELFLIIGPPGTGKTSYGMLNQLQEELLEPGSSILILSYTNRAVDEICSKLVEQGIDFVRIGSPLSCDKRYHPYLFDQRVGQMEHEAEVRQLVEQCRVFCATTTTMNSHSELFALKRFDLAIIDESSQILEPQLVGLFSALHNGEPAVKRWVLIGDHKQLPAVVQQSAEESMVADPELIKIGLTNCRLSLFERLLAEFKTNDGYDPRFVYMLQKQGRMHEQIAQYASQAFYGGKLQVVPLPHQTVPCQPCEGSAIRQLLTSRRIAFVNAPKPDHTGMAKSNSVEAHIIAEMVVEAYRLNEDTFDPDQTVGVIVPYRNQIATIRTAIDQYGIDVLHHITIDTVERFQGSQRDYIIYGFTVTERYQLAFLAGNRFVEDGQLIDRKLNVAMTRARMHLLMVGHAPLLRQDPVFRQLIEVIDVVDGIA